MGNGTFHTTRWSLVTRAGASEPATAARALGELCELYWLPLYAFARRSGQDDHAACDLVQSFCAELLEHGGLAGANANVGRFRNYLLGAFRHFTDNTQRSARAAKRGGAVTTWRFDDAADRYALAANDEHDPQRAFERQWALALLERAQGRLRAEHATPPKRELLAALEPHLLVEDDRGSAADLALHLGTSAGAVRVALHRVRSRLRELIRDEVAQTVAEPGEIDDELRSLQAALAAR